MSQQISESASYPGPPEQYLRNASAEETAVAEEESRAGALPPVHGSRTICSPSPFAPHGGAREWQSNELLLKDECLRKLAFVAPLDCAINQTYYTNPVKKL